MLSPEEILRISEGAEDIAEELHQDILNRVIDRIMIRIGRKENYRLTAVDKWQLETLKDAGFLMEDIQKEIAKRTGMQRKEIKEAFEDAGVRSARYDDAIYEAAGLSPTPLLESPQYVRILQRGYNATNGEWTNFTRTLAGEAQQTFIRECDQAYQMVSSGAVSYTEAVRETINRLADEGVKVHYPSGRTDTIETATMRAVRTGISQTCADVTEARMEEMGWDIVLVSSHLGARYTEKQDYTNHMWWQGKFYSKSGKDPRFPPFDVCGFGKIQGICGANCRHSYGPGDGEFNPYDQFDSEENKRAYDLSQEQRGYERKIRDTKRKTMAIKEGRDAAEDKKIRDDLDLDYQKSAAKLQAQNKAYKEFCERNGLKTRAERTQIAKWDREQAAQARGAAIRYKNTQNPTVGINKKVDTTNRNVDTETVEISLANREKSLTNRTNNGTIEERSEKRIVPITDEAIERVPYVQLDGYTEEQCRYIQEQQRELLRVARDENDNGEVGFLYREDLSDRIVIKGSDTDIEFGLRTETRGNNQIILHNHPRCSTFSQRDIAEWISNDQVKVLTIVKNNGEIETISKNRSFDRDKSAILFKRLLKNSIRQGKEFDFEKSIQKFLLKGEGFTWKKATT